MDNGSVTRPTTSSSWYPSTRYAPRLKVRVKTPSMVVDMIEKIGRIEDGLV